MYGIGAAADSRTKYLTNRYLIQSASGKVMVRNPYFLVVFLVGCGGTYIGTSSSLPGCPGWAKSLRRWRFRRLGGRDTSFRTAHENLHGVLVFARLVGVFEGVR